MGKVPSSLHIFDCFTTCDVRTQSHISGNIFLYNLRRECARLVNRRTWVRIDFRRNSFIFKSCGYGHRLVTLSTTVNVI